LKRILADYVRYYHDDRTHLGLRKQTPGGRVHSAARCHVLFSHTTRWLAPSIRSRGMKTMPKRIMQFIVAQNTCERFVGRASRVGFRDRIPRIFQLRDSPPCTFSVCSLDCGEAHSHEGRGAGKRGVRTFHCTLPRLAASSTLSMRTDFLVGT